MNITVPWRFELGAAIALGAIFTFAANADAVVLCNKLQRCPIAASCASPQTVGSVTFLGKTSGLPIVTVDGKTKHALCLTFDGRTDTVAVVYDEIFSSGFNP